MTRIGFGHALGSSIDQVSLARFLFNLVRLIESVSNALCDFFRHIIITRRDEIYGGATRSNYNAVRTDVIMSSGGTCLL